MGTFQIPGGRGGIGSGGTSGSVVTGTVGRGSTFNYKNVITHDERSLYEYQLLVTLDGSGSQNIDLFLDYPCKLQKYILYFNDATSKTLTVDMYAMSFGGLDRIDTFTTDTTQYITRTDIKREYLFPQFLRFAFTASTLNKTVEISVFVEEILEREVQKEDIQKVEIVKVSLGVD